LPSGVPIILVVPFDATIGPEQKPFLIAAAAACSAPSRVTVVSTTGWLDTSLTADGIHPLGIANAKTLGPNLASAVAAVLGTSGSAPSGGHIIGG
jgi:hypothetical protein